MAMRAKISMIAVNMTAYPSVRKPALDAPEPIELEFARDTCEVRVSRTVVRPGKVDTFSRNKILSGQESEAP
jgi:hypothetical protein